MRCLISKRGQFFLHWKLWEQWEPNFRWGTSFLSLKIMRTLRSLISKKGQISFFLWKSWELWEVWFRIGDKFSFIEIMRTMRSLISKKGQVFFHWKSWELWEAWFQRRGQTSFSEKHENTEKPWYWDNFIWFWIVILRSWKVLMFSCFGTWIPVLYPQLREEQIQP